MYFNAIIEGEKAYNFIFHVEILIKYNVQIYIHIYFPPEKKKYILDIFEKSGQDETRPARVKFEPKPDWTQNNWS